MAHQTQICWRHCRPSVGVSNSIALAALPPKHCRLKLHVGCPVAHHTSQVIYIFKLHFGGPAGQMSPAQMRWRHCRPVAGVSNSIALAAMPPKHCRTKLRFDCPAAQMPAAQRCWRLHPPRIFFSKLHFGGPACQTSAAQVCWRPRRPSFLVSNVKISNSVGTAVQALSSPTALWRHRRPNR